MTNQSGDSQIKSIYQLCIRRLSAEKFNFSFIYQMVGGGMTWQEYELTYDQAKAYFTKHGWPLVLPEIEGKTIQVVRNGRPVSQHQNQERRLPPK